MKKRLHKTRTKRLKTIDEMHRKRRETIRFKIIRAVNAVKPCCQTSANDEEMPTESTLFEGQTIGEIHIVPKQ